MTFTCYSPERAQIGGILATRFAVRPPGYRVRYHSDSRMSPPETVLWVLFQNRMDRMTSELSDTVKTSNFCVLAQPFAGFFLSCSSII